MITLETDRAREIAAVIGLRLARTGDTLSDPAHAVILESMSFPEPVIEEAERFRPTVRTEDLLGRRDFRERRIVTIDGETAKDFDDAVEVERTATGFRLGVHIADVSHYVREGTALDDEARSRGTSVYFPGRVLPMLPEHLSNGLCSLNPGVDRLVLSALLETDRKGRVVSAEFVKGVINLRGKVIPVVDLRLKFNLTQADYTDRTCIIVVEMALRSTVALIGVVVDSVSDVVSIAAEEIEAAPDLTEQDGSGCVEALAKVKGTVKIIVNLDRLFGSDEAEITAAGSAGTAAPLDDALGGPSAGRRSRS